MLLPWIQQELAQANQSNPLVVVAVALASLSPLITATGTLVNRRRGGRADAERKAHQTRVENGIKAVQREVGELRDETRRSTQALEKRVDGAYAILTGTIDGDGLNGVRGTSKDHESRIRVLESSEPQRGEDVGTYQQTPRLAR
jgi:hypothetical protein